MLARAGWKGVRAASCGSRAWRPRNAKGSGREILRGVYTEPVERLWDDHNFGLKLFARQHTTVLSHK